MRGLLIRIGVIALVVVGGLVLRQYMSGNAGDLQVGDCFDLPTGTTTVVEKVQHHPCTEAHTAEIVFVGNYPGSKSDAYPADSAMISFVSSSCVPAYRTYTGMDLSAAADWDVSWFQPTQDGWKNGDLEVSCYLYRIDRASFSGSRKHSG